MENNRIDLSRFDGHTPGPWNNEYDFPLMENRDIHETEWSHEPNRRLALSAPDLLAALKESRKENEELRERIKVYEYWNDLRWRKNRRTMTMSNKYIPYGPGKDIDPEEVDEEIARGTYYGDSYALGKLANKLIDALQQREERMLRTMRYLDCTDDVRLNSYGLEVVEAVQRMLVEGTDGE